MHMDDRKKKVEGAAVCVPAVAFSPHFSIDRMVDKRRYICINLDHPKDDIDRNIEFIAHCVYLLAR